MRMTGLDKIYESLTTRRSTSPAARFMLDLCSYSQKSLDEEYQCILEKYKIQFEEKWEKCRASCTGKDLEDYERFQTVGCGSFGRVILTKHKSTGKFWAMKILDKARLVKLRQVEHTLNERRVLLSINYPFIIYMAQLFKNNSYLYFIIPFINGGEMFTLLRRRNMFEENLAKFYATQVALALEYLHHLELIYRDLKPENILIDYEGYIKITDLGFCKLVKNGRTWTICGTPEYLAPEVILSKGYGCSIDWWSFGVLIYEMVAGYVPFYSSEPIKLYEKIVRGKFKHANHSSEEVQDLIHNLLQVDLTRRYGNLRGGTSDIKNHIWFKDINWMDIYNRKIEPPYIPEVKGPGDTSNFEIFPEEPQAISSIDLFPNEFAAF